MRSGEARLRPAAGGSGVSVRTSQRALDEALMLGGGGDAPVLPALLTRELAGLANLPRDLQEALAVSADGKAAAERQASPAAGRVCQPGDALALPLSVESGAAASTAASLGSLEVVWSPLGGVGAGQRTATALPLPCVDVHDPPLVAEVTAPTSGAPDVPFTVVLALHNRSSALASTIARARASARWPGWGGR